MSASYDSHEPVPTIYYRSHSSAITLCSRHDIVDGSRIVNDKRPTTGIPDERILLIEPLTFR